MCTASSSRRRNASLHVIAEHTDVSSEVDKSMAEGVKAALGSDYALSLTGEAGPQTNSKSQVGTIWIGLSNGEGTWTFRREYHGTRNIIRNRAAHAALDILRRHLLDLPIAE